MKQITVDCGNPHLGRPLTRGRGLKPSIGNAFLGGNKSPPHTGAWIETESAEYARATAASPPHTGAWIETKWLLSKPNQFRVAPSHGGVD